MIAEQLTDLISYEALGLAHSLNPVAQGGAEGPVASATTGSTPAPASEPAVAPTSSKDIPRGFGKIIRDENGAVLRIELPEENEEALAGTAQSNKKGKGRASETWGDAMDDSDEEAEKMIPPEASSWLRIGGGEPKQESNPDGLGISQQKEGKPLIRGKFCIVNFQPISNVLAGYQRWRSSLQVLSRYHDTRVVMRWFG